MNCSGCQQLGRPKKGRESGGGELCDDERLEEHRDDLGEDREPRGHQGALRRREERLTAGRSGDADDDRRGQRRQDARGGLGCRSGWGVSGLEFPVLPTLFNFKFRFLFSFS